jgi:hypothetical protein
MKKLSNTTLRNAKELNPKTAHFLKGLIEAQEFRKFIRKVNERDASINSWSLEDEKDETPFDWTLRDI